MVNILVEKDGEILSFPVNKFINPELDKQLEEYNKTIEDNEEEPEMLEEPSDIKKYTFKNSEVFVTLSSTNSKQAVVTVHKPNIDMKVNYELSESKLYELLLTYVSRPLGLDSCTKDDYDKYYRLVKKHFSHNHYKIHYQNRKGIYYSATFKDKNKPSSLSSDFIFEVENTSLSRFSNGTSLNMTHTKRPVLNNIYPHKTICWGGVTRAPILTSSKTIFEASERMLSFFLGSTFNRDLSSHARITNENFRLAIKRNFNEPEITGLSDEEYDYLRGRVLEALPESRTAFNLYNIGFLMLMSFLNLDFSDIEYMMGE